MVELLNEYIFDNEIGSEHFEDIYEGHRKEIS